MRDQLNNLPGRFRGLAAPLLIGIFLLIGIAVGLVYLQQQSEQTDLKAEIAQLNTQISRPVQTSTTLEEQYRAAKQSIPIGLKEEDVITAVLGITEELGFDVSIESSSDVSIKSDRVLSEIIAGSTYKVLSFRINIKGDHEKVMTFIYEMDSTSILKTLVLKKISITKEEGQTSAGLHFNVYTLER
ncbi:hypothetical protein ACFLW2_05260 [Chloroflexota bacterium]